MIIDEKGRIFGKINVIDFAVLLFIVIIIPMFFISNKIINVKKPEAIKQEVVIPVEVKFIRVMPEFAKVMKEGDIAKDENGKVTGKLIKIIKEEPSRVSLSSYDGGVKDLSVISDLDCRDIKASFELNCVVENSVFVYRGYAVKIGNPLVFSTDLYCLQGIITGVNK